jgi:hypothetical protein
MWPEYYYPNITQLELEELKFHNGSLPLLSLSPFSLSSGSSLRHT